MLPFLLTASCQKSEPIDEAKAAGKSTADFPQISADVFKPMDGGIPLSAKEIMGRNAWNLWSGGNEHFWNHVAQDSYGLMDLLKMLDNRKYNRGERFKTLGLVNEPGSKRVKMENEKSSSSPLPLTVWGKRLYSLALDCRGDCKWQILELT